MKLTFTFVLFLAALYGQVDVLTSGANNSQTLASRVTWGCAGAGCTDNNYIISPLNRDTATVCLWFQNTDTVNANVVNLTTHVSPDPSANAFINNVAKWSFGKIGRAHV